MRFWEPGFTPGESWGGWEGRGQPQEVVEVNEPDGKRIINLFPEQQGQDTEPFSVLTRLQADFTHDCTFGAAS